MPDLDHVYLPPENLYEIIEQLKQLRIDANVTTAEVSYAIGSYTHYTVARWESHTNRPSWTALRKWANALGMKVELTVTLVPTGEGHVFPRLDRPEVEMMSSVQLRGDNYDPVDAT
jgi:transcriptional regulator with XRE-family HTH domain